MKQEKIGTSNDESVVSKVDEERSEVSTSKRALLLKGWVAPVIIGVSLPRSGFATNISTEYPGS